MPFATRAYGPTHILMSMSLLSGIFFSFVQIYLFIYYHPKIRWLQCRMINTIKWESKYIQHFKCNDWTNNGFLLLLLLLYGKQLYIIIAVDEMKYWNRCRINLSINVASWHCITFKIHHTWSIIIIERIINLTIKHDENNNPSNSAKKNNGKMNIENIERIQKQELSATTN